MSETLPPLDETTCSAEKILADVMQDIWNDRAMDCGEIPQCFDVLGPRTTRITADFEDSTFVSNIVETLRTRGYSILPNESSDGAAGSGPNSP